MCGGCGHVCVRVGVRMCVERVHVCACALAMVCVEWRESVYVCMCVFACVCARVCVCTYVSRESLGAFVLTQLNLSANQTKPRRQGGRHARQLYIYIYICSPGHRVSRPPITGSVGRRAQGQ